MKAISFTAIFLFICAVSFGQTVKTSPKAQALKQLSLMKPALEKKYKGVMDEPKAIVGDVNGDGRQDCILSYVFTPKGGGNMIVANLSTLFLNTGGGVKNAGNLPELKFCYTPKTISNQQIIVGVYTCAPPYNDDLGTAKLAYQNGKFVLVK